MIKFWADNSEFSASEEKLLNALSDAHGACVWRNNASTMALQQAAGGSGRLCNALVAALSTLGVNHGPIEEAHALLGADDRREEARKILALGRKVPGWGNSFIRDGIDPAFQEVDQCLQAEFPAWYGRLTEITGYLHAAGKSVWPNPGGYTAIAALVLGMPGNLSPALFVGARLWEWVRLFDLISNPKKP